MSIFKNETLYGILDEQLQGFEHFHSNILSWVPLSADQINWQKPIKKIRRSNNCISIFFHSFFRPWIDVDNYVQASDGVTVALVFLSALFIGHRPICYVASRLSVPVSTTKQPGAYLFTYFFTYLRRSYSRWIPYQSVPYPVFQFHYINL